MAASLAAWLHDEVKTQLALGNSWLAEKSKAKAALNRPSAAVDKKWAGLYHDNASCIDIVGPIGSAPVHVLVLETSPLTVADSRHHTQASLTTACRRDLQAKHPGRDVAAGTLLAIHKYTIRHTSYGPPRDKLRLILDAVGWVGERQLWVGPVQPLHSSADIAAALQQLHDTRALEDDRCLQSHPKEEEDLDQGMHTMAGEEEPLNDDASMNTQMPFGTQMQHPIRPRRTDEDLQFVGINRLEPVLAGNTQRAELKPGNSAAVNAAADKQKKLLSLLGPVNPPVAPRAHVRPQPVRLEHDAGTSSPRRNETPSKRANRERLDDLVRASQTPTRSDLGRKRSRDVGDQVSSTHHSSKKPSFSETDPKQKHIDEMDKFAAECSWMKGLNFNRDSATVPLDQVSILSRPESWHKPAVGQRFPGANLPMEAFITLSRLADERIATEAALEASSGSYNETDPSPGSYPPTSAPQPEDEQEDESDDEAISWHTSPSPQPPQRPTLPRQGLPPDSSTELPEHVPESAVLPRPAATRDPSPQPTLPLSSNENEGVGPPSSPPGPQAAHVSDDEMELEMSVPQALGEDLDVPSTSRPVSDRVPQNEPRSRSVVQMKETPCVKGKHSQPVVTISPPTQEPDDRQQNSSSASIVRGTYHGFSSSAVEETHLDTLQDERQKQANSKQTETIQEAVPAQPEATPMSAQLPLKDSSSGEQAAPAPVEGTSAPVQAVREPSRQPSATPSITKRKLETTPTRGRKRHKKGRALKLVSFSGKDTETLKREYQESLRGSESERPKSSTSVESRHGSVSNLSVHQDADAKVVPDANVVIKPQAGANVTEGDMSPRHQSLYAAPSPILRPSTGPAAPASVPESMDIVQSENLPMPQPEPHVEHSTAPEHLPEPQLQAQPEVTQPGPEVRPPPAPPVDTAIPSTIFDTFKATYPEYTGNVKHFKNQCSQIDEFEREDRMVPKWMWDDYIVRSRTDYKHYVDDCLDLGEPPMPYLRFYKDTVRDTIYKKGVIKTTATLLKALQELGAQPHSVETQPVVQQAAPSSSHQSPRPTVRQSTHTRQAIQQSPRPSAQQPAQFTMPSPAQSAITPPKKKPSRKSLPFLKPESSNQLHPNNTPRVRHSLPPNSSRATPSASTRPPASTRRESTAKFFKNLQASAASDPPPDPDGDEFRKFSKAQNALTSVTGSTRVDRTKQWPESLEGRPSIKDLPRGNVDVLTWADEL